MNEIDILKEFLMFPLGNSNEVFEKFAAINGAIQRGNGLDRFLYVRGKRDNKVLLVAHADTYWDERYGVSGAGEQNILCEDGIIKNLNGGLGADDRAGCAMIWLLRDLGHSILITDGEEHGMRGSNWLMKENKDIAIEINKNHQFAIQLDGRNSKDFKCYSVGISDFRKYIMETTGYSEPDQTASTDIVNLCQDIVGVNLSIGYFNKHKEYEFLNVNDWNNTLNICRKWLSQDNLPHFNRNVIPE